MCMHMHIYINIHTHTYIYIHTQNPEALSGGSLAEVFTGGRALAGLSHARTLRSHRGGAESSATEECHALRVDSNHEFPKPLYFVGSSRKVRKPLVEILGKLPLKVVLVVEGRT